jgi:uncharacterized protein YdeI (YjbR/CyaY-like superfamily)
MAKAIPKTSTYYAPDRADWRKWLEENHATSEGIWLVYYKKESGKSRVHYAEAVEEALCFGWIDSTLNPIDEQKYMQLFTPRKPKSAWSKLNKERVEKLLKEGLMTPAGIAKTEAAKHHGSWEENDSVEAFSLPEELEIAFAENPRALEFFNSLSNTNRKMILYYLNNAKKPETKFARIKEIIAATNESRLLARHEKK